MPEALVEKAGLGGAGGDGHQDLIPAGFNGIPGFAGFTGADGGPGLNGALGIDSTLHVPPGSITPGPAPTHAAASHPTVIGNPNTGNLAVFFNSDGQLAENVFTRSTNTWSGPKVLPGGNPPDAASPMVVGSPNSGNIAVVYNSGGSLACDLYTGSTGTWATPVVLANDIKGDPSVLPLPAPVRADRRSPSWAPSFLITSHLHSVYTAQPANSAARGRPVSRRCQPRRGAAPRRPPRAAAPRPGHLGPHLCS